MKTSRFFLYIWLVVSLVSCAGSQSAVRTENVPPAPAQPAKQAPPRPAEVKPQTPPIPTEAAPQPPETPVLPAIDGAVLRVKQNQPDIEKYFVLNAETSGITVMANVSEQAEDFVVTYDLLNAVPDGNDRFTVSFSVTGKQSDESRSNTLLWDLREDKTGLLLALDDNYMDVWTQYLALFDRYGARITFFIQGYANAFCKLALQRGHDVGYHSINHLNLSKVSHEVFVEETTSDIGNWRDAGIPLLSFAYPFGLSESWMHEELLKHFKILRGYGVTFRVYDRATIQQGYISSRAIDNILFKTDADFESMITLMFRTLKFLGRERILPLTTHTIAPDVDWGITPSRLEYVLKTAHDLRLVFYRYSDVIKP
jgi:peptidoglycan/xylan/chitin deacetylase (PgdA/CDA1 family)